MKLKALHLGKAISAALFVLLLSVAGMKNALAQTQVATLQHGETITAYYGSGALSSAYSAASDGDVITLSGGTFTGCNFDKSLTIRGAGAVADYETGTGPTIVTGDYSIGYNYSITGIHFEGIYFTGSMQIQKQTDPTFIRCNFTKITCGGNYTDNSGAHFINCVIKELEAARFHNTTFTNCVIDYFRYFTGGTYTFDHCQVTKGCGQDFNGVVAVNSIFVLKNGTQPAGSNCIFNNCIGICELSSYNQFGTATLQNCVSYTTDNGANPYEQVYEEYRGGDFNFEGTYTLLPNLNFPTTDGTEVGIYGGSVPYTARPSYQMLRTINAAQQSDTQGKLNVEIEVINQ